MPNFDFSSAEFDNIESEGSVESPQLEQDQNVQPPVTIDKDENGNQVFKLGAQFVDIIKQSGFGIAEAAADNAHTLSIPAAAFTSFIESTATGKPFNEAFQDQQAYSNEVKEQVEQTLPASENPVSDVARHITEFLASYGIATASGVSNPYLAGAVADFTSIDKAEGDLSNLIESNPSLHNPITEFLSINDDDPVVVAKAKGAIEGLALGGLTEGLLKFLKGLKAAKKGKPLSEAIQETANTPDAQLLDTLRNPADRTLSDKQVKKIGSRGSSMKVEGLNPEKIDLDIKEKGILDEVAKNVRSQVKKLGAGKKKKLSKTKFKSTQRLQKHYQQLVKEEGTQLDSDLAALAKVPADEVLVAAKQHLLDLAKEFNRVNKAILNGDTSPELLTAQNDLANRMADFMPKIKAAQTNTARAVSSGRIKISPSESKMFAQAMKVLGEDNPEGMLDVLGKVKKVGMVEVLNEYWINALFSPTTMSVNLVNNAINTAVLPGQKMLGGALTMSREEFAQGVGIYRGYIKHFKDSFKMAAKSFELEENILDTGSTAVESFQKAITAETFGLENNSILGMSVNALGNVFRVPSRVLSSTDEFFKQLNYRSYVESKAYQDGMNLGLEGEKLAKFITDTQQSSINSSGKAIDKGALEWARMSTFTQELDDSTFIKNFGSSVDQLVRKHPLVARHVVPFVRVPTNILDMSVDYTPAVNLTRKKMRADLLGQNGVEAKALASAKLATSVSLVGAGTHLAMEGFITGSGPFDKAQRETLEATGWKPYSIKVGNKFYPMQRFEPYSIPFMLAADFVDVAPELPEKDLGELAATIGILISKNFTSKTYMKGVADLLELADTQDESTLETRGGRYLQKQAASFIPSSIRSISDDPMYREVRSFMDALKYKAGFGDGTGILGLGDGQPLDPKRNMFGESRMPSRFIDYDSNNASMSWETAANSALGFIGGAEYKEDPVSEELRSLVNEQQARFPVATDKLGNIDLTKYKNSSNQTAADRRREYIGIVSVDGQDIRSKFNEFFKSAQYKDAGKAVIDPAVGTLTTGTQRDMAQSLFGAFKEAANGQFLENEALEFKNSEGFTLRDALEMDARNIQKTAKPHALRLEKDNILENINPK